MTEMIPDRIVVGILNSTLSDQLQLDPHLTLEKATAKVHQSGAVKQQQPIVQGNSTQNSAEALYQPVKSVFDNKGPISKGHSYSPIGQSYRVEANHNIFIAVQQLPLVVLHVGRSQITLDFNVLPVTLSAISVRKEDTTK